MFREALSGCGLAATFAGGAGGLVCVRTGLCAQRREEILHGKRVENVRLFEPPAARHLHAVTDKREVGSGVRVGGDDDFYSALLGHAQVSVLEVEAVGIGVAFHGDAVFRGGGENLLHVVVKCIAAQQQASGGVGDDLRVGILDGGEDAI